METFNIIVLNCPSQKLYFCSFSPEGDSLWGLQPMSAAWLNKDKADKVEEFLIRVEGLKKDNLSREVYMNNDETEKVEI